MDKFGDLW